MCFRVYLKTLVCGNTLLNFFFLFRYTIKVGVLKFLTQRRNRNNVLFKYTYYTIYTKNSLMGTCIESNILLPIR